MPKNDDFLRDYYKDAQEQMRWRGNTEYRLLQYLLIFYPVILAAMSTLFGSNISCIAYLLLTIGASVFIFLTTLFVTQKIRAEHKNYAEVGKVVQKVWKYFEFFEVGAYLEKDSMLSEKLLDSEKGYGQGPGYKKTLFIIWIITVTVIVMVLTLGIIRYC